MNYEFNSIESYKKLIPCLNSKVKELKRYGIDYIKKEDIWNYLIKNVWKDNVPYLSDMVNDILKVDNKTLVDYTKEAIKKRKVEREGDEQLL